MQPQNSTLVEPGVYRLDLGKDTTGKDTFKYVDKTGSWLPSYSPAFQSTTQQDRKDLQTATTIDKLAGTTTPMNQNGTMNRNAVETPQNTQEQKNPDGTPKTTYKAPDGTTTLSEQQTGGSYVYKSPSTLQEGEKYAYGPDQRRYIVSKDGTTRNDTYADQEYEANQSSIRRENERNQLFDSMKANLDTAHTQLVDSIKSTFAVRRAKMEEINKRFTALKTNEGFSGGQARYMSDVNNGVLQDTELQGETRLAEIDAQEKTLLAQAVQAKTDKDFALAKEKLDELDSLRKEKQDTIQEVYKAAVAFNKNIDDQEKELRLKEKEQFDMATKSLTTSAPALVKAYDALKDKTKRAEFITAMAKKLGVAEEVIIGSMEDQRTQSAKDIADINAKNRSNQKGIDGEKGTVTERRAADIAAIIDDFTATMRTRQWKGANPEAYDFYKKQILEQYGSAGVNELNKAMEAMGIKVDKSK